MAVARGENRQFHAEGALRDGVDRVEAGHPACRDVRLSAIDEARVRLLLQRRGLRDDRAAVTVRASPALAALAGAHLRTPPPADVPDLRSGGAHQSRVYDP